MEHLLQLMVERWNLPEKEVREFLIPAFLPPIPHDSEEDPISKNEQNLFFLREAATFLVQETLLSLIKKDEEEVESSDLSSINNDLKIRT